MNIFSILISSFLLCKKLQTFVDCICLDDQVWITGYEKEQRTKYPRDNANQRMKVLHEKNNTLCISANDQIIIKDIADQYYAPRKAHVQIKQGPTMSTLTHKFTHLKRQSVQSFWLHRAKYCVSCIHFFQIYLSRYCSVPSQKILRSWRLKNVTSKKRTICFVEKEPCDAESAAYRAEKAVQRGNWDLAKSCSTMLPKI